MKSRESACVVLLVILITLVSRAVAAEPAPPAPPQISAIVPITGADVPQLAAFDSALVKYMTERKFQAGVLAVSRNGQIIFEHGYGRSASGPVQPDTLMRIASVTKPFTAAAIHKLIAEGKLSLTTPVFSLLDFKAPEGATPDPRLAKITVGHLLGHRGGWDRETSFDPMFADVRIRIALKLDHDPDQYEIIRYMMGQPLQFDPGSRDAYSNFGFCVLGRVIEKVSGKSYMDYIKSEITGPVGAKNIQVGRTDPGLRPKNEVAYPPDRQVMHMERMDSHGGLLSTAGDMLRFSARYWIDGQPRGKKDKRSYVMFGSLPGTTSMLMQRPAGVDVAVIFNGRIVRNNDPQPDLDDLRKLMDATTESIKEWPESK